MDSVNKQLVEYIEKNIFPVYQKNDAGHRIDHIEYVIQRSLKFAEQFENIDLNMVYAIASFHDIAHHIDKDNHEVLSAQIFYENEEMKKYFTDEQRKIIKEAIEDHRASLEYEPRSDYGKIVSSADRNVFVDTSMKRTHAYTMKHCPGLTVEQMIHRAYEHLLKKFGVDGYAKSYCYDEQFEQFKKDIGELLKDENAFAVRYMQVNGLKDKDILDEKSYGARSRKVHM